MPELPEVQTIVSGLSNKIIGKKIVGIIEYRPGTVLFSGDLAGLLPAEISGIGRRGKYIIISTAHSFTLIIHLRMTGRLIYGKGENTFFRHLRARLNLDDGSRLYFDDIRTFGKIIICEPGKQYEPLTKLGPEPLSEGFNAEYLQNKIRSRPAPVKNIMLDQSVVAGLGNIYVSEILFRSGISPLKKASELVPDEIDRIIDATGKILIDAIQHGGTTISDYRNYNNEKGSYQDHLKVYAQQKCVCGVDITRIKQAGRSTFFCNHCQK